MNAKLNSAVALALLSGAVYGQPPDVVNSDVYGNTAAGTNALLYLLAPGYTGFDNTAVGWDALLYTSYGNSNTAVGGEALINNTTGSDNIALGYKAGTGVTTGSNNIEIGNPGTQADNNVIYLGIQGT